MHMNFRYCCNQISLIFFFGLLAKTTGYQKMTRPKGFGNIPQRELDTSNPDTKMKIVLIHNFHRTKVNPPASNMLEMKWHKGAQEAAQKWAESCKRLVHDNPLGRWVEDFGSCGQNIYVSNVKVPWRVVMKAWFSENVNFTYGRNDNSLKDVGHYTQMIWYNSHRIGCGFHYCGKEVANRPFYNYVCNYCPIGNHPKKLGTPYAAGKPCSKCENHCKYSKLCTNSCRYADLWSNCAQLNVTWNRWLCGKEEHQGCRATCECPGAVL